MAKEIERKYLVKDLSYREMAESHVRIEQGYLCREPERTVRVRIKGERGFLTIKGITRGFTRDEFEYEIPLADAEKMLAMCQGRIVKKIRWNVPYKGYHWEVDEFEGLETPLTVAEIELPSAETEFSEPPFIGMEVTGDPRYYNSNL